MSFVRKEWAAWRAAMMFFTRWPMRSHADWDPESLQRSAAWFPAVGLVVGAVGAATWWIATILVGWPPEIASGLSMAATILFTGAFHEDGWADVCDGLGGGYTKERSLEIMKDSRIGAFGAVGLVLMLGLKWQAVAALPSAVVVLALIAMHMGSRGMVGLLMAGLRYAAEEGKAKPLATRLCGMRLGWALLTGLLPIYFLPGSGVVLGAMLVTTLIAGMVFKSRIGGYTGDCLGATQQITELTGYLTLLAWMR